MKNRSNHEKSLKLLTKYCCYNNSLQIKLHCSFSMALSWMTINSNLVQAVSLINSLQKETYQEILNHVVTQSKSGKPSTEDQLEELRSAVKIKQDDLVLVMQSLAYILKQASKVILKPTVLQNHLSEICKIDVEKAEELVKVWTEDTKTSFPLENRMKLENVAWDLNLETASSSCYKETIPNAHLQLSLTTVDESEKENLILDLNEEELVSLYRTIENIQVKLDAIQSAVKN